MRIPHTVPAQTFDVYRCSEETKLLLNEIKRTLRAEDEGWYEKALPPDLKTQALRVIAAGWLGNPIAWDKLPTLDDRDQLLELLPNDLPFEFAITRIPYEHYWHRASEARWEFNDPTEHGNSWLRLYCERHLWEYLERLDPAYFESERDQLEALINLVAEHVRTIKLVHLRPYRSELVPKMISEDDEDDDGFREKPFRNAPTQHLPLGEVLLMLPNLTDVYLNFGMVYRTTPVSVHAFELSVEDCISIGRGVKGLRRLRSLSITRSKVDQPKVAAVLQGLAVNAHLEDLDLSHCELGDEGAQAVGAYLVLSRVKSVNLANNKIGPRGMAGIALGLLKDEDREPCLRRLCLRLNPLGDEGAAHLAALLLRNSTLEDLNVSGCGFEGDAGMQLAEVLSTGATKFKRLRLDLSNNELGPIVGEAFEVVVKSCAAIIELDMRLCGFNKESEYSIYESVMSNKTNSKRRSVNPAKSCVSARSIRDLVPPPEFARYQRPPDLTESSPVSETASSFSSSRVSLEGEGPDATSDITVTDGQASVDAVY